MPRPYALAILASGCLWISPDRLADDLDPDGDGVPHPDDCAPYDPTRSGLVAQYRDADQDGYGADPADEGCGLALGFVEIGGDCADDQPLVHPGDSPYAFDAAFTASCETPTGCEDHWVPVLTPTLDDALTALAACAEPALQPTIDVAAGDYDAPDGRPWVLVDGVQVRGIDAADRPTFHGSGATPVFTLVAGGLTDVVVDGGKAGESVAPEGGCVLVDGSDPDLAEGPVTLDGVDLRRCAAVRGGALAVLEHQVEVTLLDVVVTDATASVGAAVLVDESFVPAIEVSVSGAGPGAAIELTDADGAGTGGISRIDLEGTEGAGLRVRGGDGWRLSDVTMVGRPDEPRAASAVEILDLDGSGDLQRLEVVDWVVSIGAVVRVRLLPSGALDGSDWVIRSESPDALPTGSTGAGVEVCGAGATDQAPCSPVEGSAGASLTNVLVAARHAVGLHLVGTDPAEGASGPVVTVSFATVFGSADVGVKVDEDAAAIGLDHVLVYGEAVDPTDDFDFGDTAPGLAVLLYGRVGGGAWHERLPVCAHAAFAPLGAPASDWDAHLVATSTCAFPLDRVGQCSAVQRKDEVGYYGGEGVVSVDWYCDIDLDELADGWEERWFAGLDPEATDDDDGDGSDNLDELRSGTHPLACDTDCDGDADALDSDPLTCSLPPLACVCTWAPCGSTTP